MTKPCSAAAEHCSNDVFGNGQRSWLIGSHEQRKVCGYNHTPRQTKTQCGYHSARNQFERFLGFLELISRFEFDFRRRGFFFERFEFLVCSKFNHMQRDCSCACAVACLYPHNSISNVVASVAIHDNINIFTRDVCKKNKTIVEGRKLLSTKHHGKVSDVQIVRYCWVLSLCLCLCLCVLCIVCCSGGRGGGGGGGGGRGEEKERETNRTIRWLIPSAVSLRTAEDEQLHQVKRMIGGTCCSRSTLKMKTFKIQGFLW